MAVYQKNSKLLQKDFFADRRANARSVKKLYRGTQGMSVVSIEQSQISSARALAKHNPEQVEQIMRLKDDSAAEWALTEDDITFEKDRRGDKAEIGRGTASVYGGLLYGETAVAIKIIK